MSKSTELYPPVFDRVIPIGPHTQQQGISVSGDIYIRDVNGPQIAGISGLLKGNGPTALEMIMHPDVEITTVDDIFSSDVFGWSVDDVILAPVIDESTSFIVGLIGIFLEGNYNDNLINLKSYSFTDLSGITNVSSWRIPLVGSFIITFG